MLLYRKNDNQLVPDYKLPSLTYQFPKLFLNVINAFSQESSDDMQKCCEYYYSRIHRLNKYEKENEKLTKEYELLSKANANLEKENTELKARIKVLECEDARNKLQEKDKKIKDLLMEIELLKIKNEEQRKLYMK